MELSENSTPVPSQAFFPGTHSGLRNKEANQGRRKVEGRKDLGHKVGKKRVHVGKS